MNGKFIVFEGIDGSGKGTIIKMFENYLLESGAAKSDILVTAEPTDGKYGRELRSMLSRCKNPKENALLFLELYVKDRREHIKNTILPALSQGKIVLCDRYKYSTIAYQAAQGIPNEKLIEIHNKMPVPDIALIFDISPEIAISRIESAHERNGKDVFEKQKFLEKVRANFLRMPVFFPKENIAIIDVSNEVGNVFEVVKSELVEAGIFNEKSKSEKGAT